MRDSSDRPAMSIRVPLPLRKALIKSAKLTGRNMSQEAVTMIERGLEWTRRWKSDSDFGNMEIGIAKLELNAGDVVVLRTPMMLTAAQAKELGDRARACLPDGLKLMVLPAGLSIDAIAVNDAGEPMIAMMPASQC